jgi:hypothetical protein
MKLLSTFILIVLLSFTAFSQEYMTALTYNISAPAGETSQFIEAPSYLGLSFDARKFVTSFISVGFYTGWQVFYEQISEPLPIDQGTISGNQYRYLNSFPIMLNTHLYIGPDECFRPYVGINAGAYFTWKRLNIGVLLTEEKKWVLGFAPEAGMTIPAMFISILVQSITTPYLRVNLIIMKRLIRYSMSVFISVLRITDNLFYITYYFVVRCA